MFFRLLKGDCNEQMRNLEDASINLVLTDPPYNQNKDNQITHLNGNCKTVKEIWDKIDDYEKFSEEWIGESYRLLKPNGSLVVFASYHNLYTIGSVIKRLGMRINNNIVWYKRNSPPSVTCRMFTFSVEYAIWAVKGANWTFNYWDAKAINQGKQQQDVFDFSDFID